MSPILWTHFTVNNTEAFQMFYNVMHDNDKLCKMIQKQNF